MQVVEAVPLMVLAEETEDRVTFRFRGDRWAAATLVPGLLLAGIAVRLLLGGHRPGPLSWILGGLGLLLLWSTLYSFTATQWLQAVQSRRSVVFRKRNLYGLVAWERRADAFQGLRVGRSLRSLNWHIELVCADGTVLPLGENAFGAPDEARALALADRVARRTGIPIQAPGR
jgi:hypothetical protein